jgi:uncharacterized protein YjbI with pentapeptide repeats
MANEEQLALLKQGSEVWNAWRDENPHEPVDLCYAHLANASLSDAQLIEDSFRKGIVSESFLNSFHPLNLSGANLQRSNLQEADLRGADLKGANLRGANLEGIKLDNADVSGANFSLARLIGASLWRANLSNTNLTGAQLCIAYLESANLSGAILNEAKLSGANLTGANFSGANLSGSDLHQTRALSTNFTKATLTGACIADWHIGSSTNLDEVFCDYIYRTLDNLKIQFSGRLPVDPESTFATGEFTQRFQIIASALETIDITFTEGIDWQAFFQSFQDLRASRPNEDISIQGMERKGDAFIVRLEVETEADKAAIETEVKQRYAHQLAVLEAQYEERLRLQGAHLEDARRTIELERQRNTEILGVIGIVAQNQGSKYDMRGAQFAGGFAETVQGNQVGGIINNYGQNADDVVRLLTSLRQLSQAFPEEQKADVLMELDDLERDLSKPEKPEPKRIGKRLQRLIATGAAAATLAGGAATFTGNVNDFTANVLELGEKIGLTRDAIQP